MSELLDKLIRANRGNNNDAQMMQVLAMLLASRDRRQSSRETSRLTKRGLDLQEKTIDAGIGTADFQRQQIIDMQNRAVGAQRIERLLGNFTSGVGDQRALALDEIGGIQEAGDTSIRAGRRHAESMINQLVVLRDRALADGAEKDARERFVKLLQKIPSKMRAGVTRSGGDPLFINAMTDSYDQFLRGTIDATFTANPDASPLPGFGDVEAQSQWLEPIVTAVETVRQRAGSVFDRFPTVAEGALQTQLNKMRRGTTRATIEAKGDVLRARNRGLTNPFMDIDSRGQALGSAIGTEDSELMAALAKITEQPEALDFEALASGILPQGNAREVNMNGPATTQPSGTEATGAPAELPPGVATGQAVREGAGEIIQTGAEAVALGAQTAGGFLSGILGRDPNRGFLETTLSDVGNMMMERFPSSGAVPGAAISAPTAAPPQVAAPPAPVRAPTPVVPGNNDQDLAATLEAISALTGATNPMATPGLRFEGAAERPGTLSPIGAGMGPFFSGIQSGREEMNAIVGGVQSGEGMPIKSTAKKATVSMNLPTRDPATNSPSIPRAISLLERLTGQKPRMQMRSPIGAVSTGSPFTPRMVEALRQVMAEQQARGRARSIDSELLPLP